MKKIIAALLTLLLMIYIFSPTKTSTPSLDEQAKKAEKGLHTALSPTFSISTQKRQPASIIKSASTFKEVFDLEKCLEGGCTYPQTDPRSYELAVYRDMAAKLRSMGESLGDDSKEFDNHLLSILHFLEIPDGFVQEAALELLSRTTPTEESFEALQGMMQRGVDPLITGQIISEFEKYKSDSQKRASIEEVLLFSLERGPISSRSVIADRMLPFIQRESVEALKSILAKLPKKTPLSKSVASVIERVVE